MPDYPQAPPMSEEEVDLFLNQATIATLGSRNPDGTVHMAPAWFKYGDGCILIGTQKISRKARNVGRDNRVTVLIDIQEPPYKGVLIYGTAELEEENAIAERTSIFERHFPHDRAEKMVQGLAGQFDQVVIRIRPDRIVSYDYAKG